MPARTPRTRARQRRFTRSRRGRMAAPTEQQQRPGDETDALDEALSKSRIEELSSDDDSNEDYSDVTEDAIDGPPFPGRHILQQQQRQQRLPPWLNPDTFNLFHNDITTETSEKQTDTTAECLPLLFGKETLKEIPTNGHGIPHLNRAKHIKFLQGWLGTFPAPYVAMDASRPWIFYWCMAGLSFLGEDVSHYKERLINTVRPLQNPTGGFGGGHGQYSHCAGTYACLLALAAVGGLEVVDRRAMWHWLGEVKQADGGFCMAVGAEEDIRGAYCAMTLVTLLNLPLELPPDAPARKAGLENFSDRLGEWVGRCQTYEGGISGAPNNEAHGAYAFCALACLSIMDAPHVSIPKYLDVDALLRWLSGIQTNPEGGFAGRTNKLVDACYSHWVGGCWSLIQAALFGTAEASTVRDCWSREGLIRYLLCCAQQPGKKGGMRDKPSCRPDAYHTCYSLAGLSHAQNHFLYDTKAAVEDASTGRLVAGFNWTAVTASEDERLALGFDAEDAVKPVHPVFVLPFEVVERTRVQFQKGGL